MLATEPPAKSAAKYAERFVKRSAKQGARAVNLEPRKKAGETAGFFFVGPASSRITAARELDDGESLDFIVAD